MDCWEGQIVLMESWSAEGAGLHVIWGELQGHGYGCRVLFGSGGSLNKAGQFFVKFAKDHGNRTEN